MCDLSREEGVVIIMASVGECRIVGLWRRLLRQLSQLPLRLFVARLGKRS
jgi:hypothetical protein